MWVSGGCRSSLGLAFVGGLQYCLKLFASWIARGRWPVEQRPRRSRETAGTIDTDIDTSKTAMQISKLDMKSLAVFATVMRTKSLSFAAEQLDMTQPAVSQTISRLRTHFDDQLFVRTREGTRPTARALELLEPIKEVLRIVRERVDARPVFDPSTARRSFTFASTDFGATVFLPKLTAELRRIAPAVRVRSIPVNSVLMRAQLES